MEGSLLDQAGPMHIEPLLFAYTMWKLLLGFWFLFLGGAVGSFMNVVIYRMPERLSIVYPGSRCPKCLHPIRWFDNIPVLSWFMLWGRCRDCGARFSFRYPAVEAVVSGLFLVLAIVEGFSGGRNLPGAGLGTVSAVAWGVCAFHLFLLCTLICVTLMQYDRQLVPSNLIIPVLGFAMLASAVWPHLHPIHATLRSAGEETWQVGLTDSLLGMAVGATLGYCVGPTLTPPASTIGTRGALVAATALTGTVLGWQAIAALTMTTAAVGLLAGVAGRIWHSLVRVPITAYLAVAAVWYIISWEWIVQWLPQLGETGGWRTCGIAIVLVLLLSWTAHWLNMSRPRVENIP